MFTCWSAPAPLSSSTNTAFFAGDSGICAFAGTDPRTVLVTPSPIPVASSATAAEAATRTLRFPHSPPGASGIPAASDSVSDSGSFSSRPQREDHRPAFRFLSHGSMAPAHNISVRFIVTLCDIYRYFM
jgi:hypothetical protein